MKRRFLLPVCQQSALAIIFSFFLVGPALAQTVRISASTSGKEIAERLGAAFAKTYPQHQVAHMPSLGGNGSIRALRDGVLDIAIVSRRPGSDEKADEIVTSIKVASTPLVFASHGKAPTIQLTRKTLADIYAGKLENWPNGQRIRLILNQGRTDTAILKNISPEMESALEVALKRPGMSIGDSTEDVANRIERVENTFGTLPLSVIELESRQVKLHPVDGVMPSLQSLKEGIYPFSKPLYVLIRKDAHVGVHHFLEFIRSPQGREVLEKHVYLPDSKAKR